MKFIDTNVFVYAADSKNPAKRTIAGKLITAAVSSGGCRISVQVLNEFASDLNDGQVYCGMKAVNPFKGIG